MASVATLMRHETVTGVRDSAAHPRVLVVDDDDLVREFVRRALEKAGYIVNCAADGWHALRAIGAGDRYDVIVADVHMPGISGPQLVARLRRIGVCPKVVYLTGFAERLLQEDTRTWLDDAVLEKPCTPQELTDAVWLMLSGLYGPLDGRAQRGGSAD